MDKIKPEIHLQKILVSAEVPLHSSTDQFFGIDHSLQTAQFEVDLQTGECTGYVHAHGIVQVPSDFWAEQCQRVSDRVRGQIRSTTA